MQKMRELDSLGPKKELLLQFANRQLVIDKKLGLKKVLEEKKAPVGLILKELLSNLPPQIRLNSLALRESGVSLKGMAKTQTDLESFLDLCARLETVSEPTPQSIHREPNAVSFEISLKLK